MFSLWSPASGKGVNLSGDNVMLGSLPKGLDFKSGSEAGWLTDQILLQPVVQAKNARE